MRKVRSNENLILFKKVIERPKFTIKTITTSTPGHRKSASFGIASSETPVKPVFTSQYSKDFHLGNEKAILERLKTRQNNIVYNFKYGEVHKEVPLRALHQKANSTSHTANINSNVTVSHQKIEYQTDREELKTEEDLDRFRARVKEFIEPPEGVTAHDNYNSLKLYLTKKLTDVAVLKENLSSRFEGVKPEPKINEITSDLRIKNIRKLVRIPVLKQFDLTKSVAELKIDNVLDKIQQAKKDKEKRAEVIREARYETWSAMLNGVGRNILSQDPNDFDFEQMKEKYPRSPHGKKSPKRVLAFPEERSPQGKSPKSTKNNQKKRESGGFSGLAISPVPLTEDQKLQNARRSPVLNLGAQDRFQKRNKTAQVPKKGRFADKNESMSSIDSENSQEMERIERIDEITDKFDAYAEGFFKQMDDLAMYKSEVRVAIRRNTAKVRSHLKSSEHHLKALKIKFRNAIHYLLHKLKSLRLTYHEILTEKVFSTKPFEHEDSHEFFKCCKEGQFSKVRNMLELNKYLVYDFDATKQTALHWACLRGNSRITKLLLEYGADPDVVDISGRSPLFQAAKANNLVNVKLLLLNHANPLIKSDGRKTALDYAEQFDVRNLLLKAQKVQYTLSMNPIRNRDKIWNSYGKPNYVVKDKELH